MTDDLIKLEPCPFCGSAAEDAGISNFPRHFVHCSNQACRLFFTEFRPPEWNNRTNKKDVVMPDFPGYRVSILNCDGHVVERFDYNVAALKAAGVDEGSIPYCPLAAFQRAMNEGGAGLRASVDRWALLEDEFITVHVVDPSRSSRDIYTYQEWLLQAKAETMAG